MMITRKCLAWALLIASLFAFPLTATAACTLSPLHAVIHEGQRTQLTVTCTDLVAEKFDTVDWQRNGISEFGGALTVGITGTATSSREYRYRTPETLAEGSYIYTMTGVKGTDPAVVTDEARVVVRGGLTQLLTVNKTPGDGGTVAQMTTGTKLIDCGSTCSANVTRGSTLTLTATPAAGYSFTGWSGDCAGTGQCTLTMDGNRTVGASFTTGGACGAANGTLVHDLPAGAAACGIGSQSSTETTAALFRWTCGTVSCQATRGYTVTASAGTGGALTPTGAVLVQGGRTKAFTATPEGTNGLAVTGSCGGTQSGTTRFTTYPITTDCTVDATFPTR